jgi:hypothetical protein
VREIEKRESLRASALLESLPETERSRVSGLLASTLHAADGLETAVEAVLANRLEGLLVESTSSALELLRELRERGVGRATVLPLRAGPERSESGFVPMGRPLADFVTVDPRARRSSRGCCATCTWSTISSFRSSASARPAGALRHARGRGADRRRAHGRLGAAARCRARARSAGSSELPSSSRFCAGSPPSRRDERARRWLAREIENTRNRRHTADSRS